MPAKTRAIAFYLPQFHPIPINDATWGDGFTEWTNVRAAKPLFWKHEQPRVPSELGYYSLLDPTARNAQADLARAHGISGFCYYHYWFGGELLLEKPLNEVLASKEPDFPFCICWANESWTRNWNGKSGGIIVSQRYSAEDDERHIAWLAHVLEDERYIKVDERPLILIYRSRSIPDVAATLRTWRSYARAHGIGELFIARVESWPDERGDPRGSGFDAAVEFQPDWLNLGQRIPTIGAPPSLYCVDYRAYTELQLRRPRPTYRRFPCATPGWDNSPRTKLKSIVLHHSSPERYEDWLRQVVALARLAEPAEPLIFINAWNEWGEGSALEPDERWGRSYLEATARALS